MYNGLICACDCCAKPLEGRVGTANVQKSYLFIKGNIGWKDKEGGVFWAKRQGDITELAFCDEKCLMGFMEGKKFVVSERIAEREQQSEW